MGVRGTQLQLLTEYLTNRTQHVKLEQCLSDELPIIHGDTMQGSIVSSTLFLCFIGVLCHLLIPDCKIIAYADNAILIFYGNSCKDAFTSAQKGFDVDIHYLAANSLTLNTSKTKYIPFCLRNTTSSSCLDLWCTIKELKR